jgi:hypothetical protein
LNSRLVRLLFLKEAIYILLEVEPVLVLLVHLHVILVVPFFVLDLENVRV